MPQTTAQRTNPPPPNPLQGENLYRLSIRFNKTVTSISINTKLLALWLFIRIILDTDLIPKISNPSSLKNFISDFVNKKVPKWESSDKSSGKGLSDYVSSCIFFDICDCIDINKDDFKEFFNSLQTNLFEG